MGRPHGLHALGVAACVIMMEWSIVVISGMGLFGVSNISNWTGYKSSGLENWNYSVNDISHAGTRSGRVDNSGAFIFSVI